MDYIVFLNLHVTAVIIWIVSMLVISVSITASAGYDTSGGGAWLSRMKCINRYITTPAMVLTWLLGITLAIKGGWFTSGWLGAKFIFVLALSAIHGIQAKTLRKWIPSADMKVPMLVRLFPLFIVVCALIIVSLALTKPF